MPNESSSLSLRKGLTDPPNPLIPKKYPASAFKPNFEFEGVFSFFDSFGASCFPFKNAKSLKS